MSIPGVRAVYFFFANFATCDVYVDNHKGTHHKSNMAANEIVWFGDSLVHLYHTIPKLSIKV